MCSNQIVVRNYIVIQKEDKLVGSVIHSSITSGSRAALFLLNNFERKGITGYFFSNRLCRTIYIGPAPELLQPDFVDKFVLLRLREPVVTAPCDYG